ncbi:MAG: HAMP domain-containing sensor histidine kinase [Candidatus Peregrinibacteria bacterium]|nr:HAMP domain-containing sensor histidine kinase [Candidatus Peregrinibacteria bacterium]
MLNASTGPTTSADVASSKNSLPHISPDEYSEIETHITSVLALLHTSELTRLRGMFHTRASGVALSQADVASADIIDSSLAEVLEVYSFLQSSRLQSKNPFLAQFLRHDFMGPLSTLLSYFRLLNECPDDPGLYPSVANLYSTVQDAEWFIGCFVKSMEFWVDPSLVAPSAVSLEPFIQHAIFYAVGRSGRMPIVHLPHDFSVQMHEGIFGVLLVNIFKNALGRGGAGEVDVDSEQIEGGRVRLTISDDGKGVADDIAPRIFELGVSGSGSTGIGLGAARERLAPSEATIECEPHGGLPSKANPGQRGAKFIIEMHQAGL